MARAKYSAVKTPSITWETVREIALTLPGAEEGTSYGTPAFRVRKALFVRLHDSGECSWSRSTRTSERCG